MAALVAVATSLFVVPIPATSGYFNLGETVILHRRVAIWATGRRFIAGMGATIADIILAGTLCLRQVPSRLKE